MSRAVLPNPTPYRVPGVVTSQARDPSGVALRVANHFFIGWAVLRVAVCTITGLDLEGFFALVIVVTAMSMVSRSLG